MFTHKKTRPNGIVNVTVNCKTSVNKINPYTHFNLSVMNIIYWTIFVCCLISLNFRSIREGEGLGRIVISIYIILTCNWLWIECILCREQNHISNIYFYFSCVWVFRVLLFDLRNCYYIILWLNVLYRDLL